MDTEKSIYFAGSIRGGRQNQLLYQEIINMLSKHGTVLTEHVGYQQTTVFGEGCNQSDFYIYKRDTCWLKQSRAMVAEVTTPSLGVGYEIGKAEELNKPTLCLYRESPDRRLSAMIAGNSKLTIIKYSDVVELEAFFDSYFEKLF